MAKERTFTFDKDDQFNRRPFADFLYRLIRDHRGYRRSDEFSSYAIALNATYGAGKTQFLRMFQSYIRERQELNVAYYNAWQHDLYGDALTPMIHAVMADDLFCAAADAHDAQVRSKAVKAAAGKILFGVGHAVLGRVLGADLGGLLKEAANAAQTAAEAGEKDPYASFHASVEELKQALSAAAAEAPLLFIIDELDRCNPAFAVQTLEVAKHLMDAEGVVFLFALDLQQLKASVARVYGDGIDADGYLCKLFDYMTHMPLPTLDEYIRHRFNEFDESFVSRHRQLVKLAVQLMQPHACSLRLVDSIIKTYRIMWDSFVSEYQNEEAECLYFFCLFLKLKAPSRYKMLCEGSEAKSRDQAFFDYEGIPIAKYLFRHCANHILKSPMTVTETSRVPITADNLKLNELGQLVFRDSKIGVRYQPFSPHEADHSLTINHLIFRYDLLAFETLQGLTYGQYIHRQLEMFNPVYQPDQE